MKKYSPNVFSTDEARLFFQLEPRKILALKGNQYVGGKVFK